MELSVYNLWKNYFELMRYWKDWLNEKKKINFVVNWGVFFGYIDLLIEFELVFIVLNSFC